MADAIAMADLDLGVATTSDQLEGREMIDEFFRVTADRAVTTAAVVRDEPPAEGVSMSPIYQAPDSSSPRLSARYTSNGVRESSRPNPSPFLHTYVQRALYLAASFSTLGSSP